MQQRFSMGGVPFSLLLPGLLTVSNSPKAYTAFSFYTPIGTISKNEADQSNAKIGELTVEWDFWPEGPVDEPGRAPGDGEAP